MKRRTLVILLGLGAVFVCSLCATGTLVFWVLSNPQIASVLNEMGSTFNGLAELQQTIREEFPADEVSVGIRNGHILTVSLINSDANQLSAPAQRAQAEVIARFAKIHYAGIAAIDLIQVSFVQQSGAFGITANFTRDYRFETIDLIESRPLS